MAGLNKVMLIGSVGRDPETRYLANGTAMTCFCLGVERTWVNADGERREVVDWFNVVTWRRLAEVCAQQLTKGARVYVEGRLETRSWEDGDGQRHYRTEVVAGDMILLDGPGARTVAAGVAEAAETRGVNGSAGATALAGNREA